MKNKKHTTKQNIQYLLGGKCVHMERICVFVQLLFGLIYGFISGVKQITHSL